MKEWPSVIPEDIAVAYKEQTMWCYHFDADTSIVSFMDTSADGVRTNAIHINESFGTPSLKSLIDEVNEWYERLAGFGHVVNIFIIGMTANIDEKKRKNASGCSMMMKIYGK